MMTANLDVTDLRVRLGGRDVLDIIELRLVDGQLAVLLGDTGSGKSLLAAALGGTIAASGTVRVHGITIAGPPSRRVRAGLAATVRDGQIISGCNVTEALHLAAGRSDRPGEALDRFPQLGRRTRVRAELLSGGEQQLLQVACAWCARPRVLVLDAPTTGLADDAAAAVVALARDEAGRGCSVLWLEQDRRAAPAAATHILISGRLAPAAGRGAGSAPDPEPLTTP